MRRRWTPNCSSSHVLSVRTRKTGKTGPNSFNWGPGSWQLDPRLTPPNLLRPTASGSQKQPTAFQPLLRTTRCYQAPAQRCRSFLHHHSQLSRRTGLSVAAWYDQGGGKLREPLSGGIVKRGTARPTATVFSSSSIEQPAGLHLHPS